MQRRLYQHLDNTNQLNRSMELIDKGTYYLLSQELKNRYKKESELNYKQLKFIE